MNQNQEPDVTEAGKDKQQTPVTSPGAALFEQYRPALHRYLARRLHNAEDARDLAQEVYLRLLRFTQEEMIKRPEAYLYRVAFNVLCDFRLREEREPRAIGPNLYNELVAELPDESPTLEEIIERQRFETRLERALEELPAMQRAVFLLQKRQGLSYARIAKELNLSVKTVKTYLFRAVHYCRRVVSEET